MRIECGPALPVVGFLVPRASVLSLGPLGCDQCLALADGGFLLESGPALGLVALTRSTVVCKRQYIIAPGCSSCSGLLILGRFLCFLGDGACAALAGASVT